MMILGFSVVITEVTFSVTGVKKLFNSVAGFSEL